MKITYMGESMAGCIGLLTVQNHITSVVSYSDDVKMIADNLHIKTYNSIYEVSIEKYLLCVYGREIVPKRLLPQVAVNIHPYLYCYKGGDPIGRAISEKNELASVGVHLMTDKVDEGEVIAERRFKVNLGSKAEIYNQMYPYYVEAVLTALDYIYLQEAGFCGETT